MVITCLTDALRHCIMFHIYEHIKIAVKYPQLQSIYVRQWFSTELIKYTILNLVSVPAPENYLMFNMYYSTP